MKAQEYVEKRLSHLLSVAGESNNLLATEDHEEIQRLIELSILERLTNHLENNQVAVIVSQGEGRWQVRTIPAEW